MKKDDLKATRGADYIGQLVFKEKSGLPKNMQDSIVNIEISNNVKVYQISTIQDVEFPHIFKFHVTNEITSTWKSGIYEFKIIEIYNNIKTTDKTTLWVE